MGEEEAIRRLKRRSRSPWYSRSPPPRYGRSRSRSHEQRCIPYKYRDGSKSSDQNAERIIEVLMINSPSGPGLLFPKVLEPSLAKGNLVLLAEVLGMGTC